MKHRCLLAGLLVCALIAGCGGGDEETAGTETTAPAAARQSPEVTVSLDGWEGPATVGIAVAYQREFFADEGIVATVLVSGNGAALKYLAGDDIEIAVVHQPQIIKAKDKGAPLLAIGSLVPEATAAMIWKGGSGIDGIADLRGRTIAIEGLPFQRQLLEQALARGGLTLDDVNVEAVYYDLVPALLSGRADAIFGGSGNLEGAALRTRGVKPVVVPLTDLGIPGYEDLVVASRRDFLTANPQIARGFMAAVARGTAVAVKNPKAAIAAVEQMDEGDPKLSARAIEAEVRATLPLLSRNASMSTRRARHLIDWMQAKGMIEQSLSPSAVLTNAYR